MSPAWIERHGRVNHTDSRTLPPAAFPSLPMDQPAVAAATSPTEASDEKDVVEFEFENEVDEDYTNGDYTNYNTDSNEGDYDEETDGVDFDDGTDVGPQHGATASTIKATQYHFSLYHPEDGQVEDKVRAEHKRLYDASLVPNFKKRKDLYPKCVNVPQARATLQELTRDKDSVIAKLSKLGYSCSDLEAFVLSKISEIIPEGTKGIETLCRNIHNLRWLIKRLKFLRSNARNVADAKKAFLAGVHSPAPAARKPWPPQLEFTEAGSKKGKRKRDDRFWPDSESNSAIKKPRRFKSKFSTAPHNLPPLKGTFSGIAQATQV
ncbi:hypothetical protein E8E13_005501 [Curvularia kusanoi]|uniref:Uncharacterized protein n=1 Tax=Curvularia kusanoi TaxID=90978 RepID=A0A9P4TA32_CURKU|nr:hypothetical protein E8E13_005501 [Curvularia kusanoi]